MIAFTSTIPTWTYLLDALGAFGIIVGGYVSTKSTYVKETSRDAALLIDTQRKRIDTLEEIVTRLDSENKDLTKKSHNMQGELSAYRKLNYIEPEVITKLTSTLDSILIILKHNESLVNKK